MKISLVIGTSREASNSLKVGKIIKNSILDEISEIEVFFNDIKEYFKRFNGNFDTELVQKWKECNKASDGFIFVIPEYNHSFPGTLKMILDEDYDNYKYKLCMIISVSSGRFGGIRMTESIISVLKSLGFFIFPTDIIIPFVENFVNEQLRSEDSIKVLEFAKKNIVEFIRVLKIMRQINK